MSPRVRQLRAILEKLEPSPARPHFRHRAAYRAINAAEEARPAVTPGGMEHLDALAQGGGIQKTARVFQHSFDDIGDLLPRGGP